MISFHISLALGFFLLFSSGKVMVQPLLIETTMVLGNIEQIKTDHWVNTIVLLFGKRDVGAFLNNTKQLQGYLFLWSNTWNVHGCMDVLLVPWNILNNWKRLSKLIFGLDSWLWFQRLMWHAKQSSLNASEKTRLSSCKASTGGKWSLMGSWWQVLCLLHLGRKLVHNVHVRNLPKYLKLVFD